VICASKKLSHVIDRTNILNQHLPKCN